MQDLKQKENSRILRPLDFFFSLWENDAFINAPWVPKTAWF